MVIFLIKNAVFLVFVGIGIFGVNSSKFLTEKPLLRHALIGLLMGIIVTFIAADAYRINDFLAPLAVKDGPLVFAGYLGGPVGATVASVFGVLIRLEIGGPNALLGSGFVVALTAFGALVGRFIPARKKPAISGLAMFVLALGAMVLQTSALPFAKWSGSENMPALFWGVALALAMSGTLSIIVTGLMVNFADNLSETERQSEINADRLKLAVKVANIGIFKRGAGTKWVHFDEGMYRIFGIPTTETKIAQNEFRKMIHPEDLPVLEDVLVQVWKDNPPSEAVAFRIRRRTGEIRHISAHWACETEPNGTVQQVIAVYQDVTVDVEMARKRNLAEARLATITDNLPGVLHSIQMTPEGEFRVTYINAFCETVFGHPREAFMADPDLYRSLHDPKDWPYMMAALRDAAKTLQPFSRRFQITTAKGDKKWLQVHASATRFESGIIQIDSIFLDVSAEVEAQARLATEIQVSSQAQKMESIGQLTGGVAHDFNNLLAVIMGNLELLREVLPDTAHRELIDEGIAATLRGADLTRNMLAFARKARLEPRVIDLNKLIGNAKNWMTRTIPANVHVETSLLAGLWQIEADPSSTESALLNLMLNGRDAMAAGGRLTIETANIRIDEAYTDSRQVELRPGRYVMLAVTDTGHGIDPETVAEIFEPFYTTKGPGKGSGLGLSMVQGFMRQSGGTVQVYSEPGVGTTFKLYFKAIECAEMRATPLATQSASVVETARILIAEDQDSVLQVLTKILEAAGYQIATAPSGDKALELFHRDPDFDLLLTDIVMPGELMGTDLAKALRALNPDLPVVFMSGYASEATVHGNGLRPEDIRLMKPVQRHDILKAIATALAGAKKGI